MTAQIIPFPLYQRFHVSIQRKPRARLTHFKKTREGASVLIHGEELLSESWESGLRILLTICPEPVDDEPCEASDVTESECEELLEDLANQVQNLALESGEDLGRMIAVLEQSSGIFWNATILLETPKNIQQAKIEKLLMPRSNNVGIDVVLVDRTVGYKEARHLLARVGYFG
jgi:hypothetical protein